MPLKRLALGLALGFGFYCLFFFFFMNHPQQGALKPFGLVLSGVNNREKYRSFPGEARRLSSSCLSALCIEGTVVQEGKRARPSFKPNKKQENVIL